jgi:hypothetical protein
MTALIIIGILLCPLWLLRELFLGWLSREVTRWRGW